MAEIIMIQTGALCRWMIPRNREHSHSGTVTVEKQRQLLEVTVSYISVQTNITLLKFAARGIAVLHKA